MSQHASFHEIPEEYASLVAELQQVMAESGTLMEAECGMVADYELYLEHDANTTTYLQNIVNQSMVILTSHQIGHNLPAPHDNQSESACESTPVGYIMNPWTSTLLSLQYSDCSKGPITAEMVSVSCLETVEEPEPGPALTVIESTVTPGNSVTVTWSGDPDCDRLVGSVSGRDRQ